VKVSGNSLIKKSSLSGNRLKNDSVKGAKIQESSLTKVPSAETADKATMATTATIATKVTPPPFMTMTYGLGWAQDTSFTFRKAGYRVDADGFVHLQGALTRTSGTGTLMASVPASIAPVNFAYIPVVTSSGAPGSIFISALGEIELYTGNPGYVSLEGVSWYPGP
jgi:hypothetical protein